MNMQSVNLFSACKPLQEFERIQKATALIQSGAATAIGGGKFLVQDDGIRHASTVSHCNCYDFQMNQIHCAGMWAAVAVTAALILVESEKAGSRAELVSILDSHANEIESLPETFKAVVRRVTLARSCALTAEA